MFRRLRLRLTAVCAVSTALVLVGMVAAAGSFSARQLRVQAAESFQGNLNAIFFYLRSQPVISHTWLAQTEADAGLWLRVERGDTQLFYTGLDERRDALTALAQREAWERHGFDPGRQPTSQLQPDTALFLLDAGESRFRAAVCRVPVEGGWLAVTVLKDRGPELSQLRRLWLSFGGMALLATLALILFAWLFSGRAVRPVEAARKGQLEFISAASHELRAPLAVMQVSAESLKDAPPQVAAGFADKILRELGRLARLTDDMLRLAGADSRGWTMSPVPTRPEELVQGALERFAPLARQREVSLELDTAAEPLPPLSCDPLRIEQLLAILLDNALEYTPAGGQVRIGAWREHRWICIAVSDSGPGIPPALREQVFHRFFRGDASRTSKDHYGLGLSVAREIAALHRGTLTAGDSAFGGAAFLLKLPLRKK